MQNCARTDRQRSASAASHIGALHGEDDRVAIVVLPREESCSAVHHVKGKVRSLHGIAAQRLASISAVETTGRVEQLPA